MNRIEDMVIRSFERQMRETQKAERARAQAVQRAEERITNSAIREFRQRRALARRSEEARRRAEERITNDAIRQFRRRMNLRRQEAMQQRRLDAQMARHRMSVAERARQFDTRVALGAIGGGGRRGGLGAVGPGGVVGSMQAIGNAASWAGRRLTHLRHNLLSYRTLLVGGVGIAAGRSFIEATVGSADDIQRSRLLLRASLGDARQVDAAFQSAIELAREIGPLTRQEALTSMRFMVPLAGGNVQQAAELTRMAKALQVTNPEQDFGGALFSLRELIGSGQVRSLRERFNISGLPTRTEAQELARQRGQTVAEVYMTEFRAKLEELYGHGGQDAVTALLAADTATVKGQVTMLFTIVQDALADLGSGTQGVLNDRLNETIDRAREFFQSKQWANLSAGIGDRMIRAANGLLDFVENLDVTVEKTERFFERYGGVLMTLAKIYGLNLVTGGAVTSAAGGAWRTVFSRGGAAAAAGGAAAVGGAAATGGLGGLAARAGGLAGRTATGARALATNPVTLLAGATALAAHTAWTLTHLDDNTEEIQRLREELRESRRATLEQRVVIQRNTDVLSATLSPQSATVAAARADTVERILTEAKRSSVLQATMYTDGRNRYSLQDSPEIAASRAMARARIYGLFGGPGARFSASDETQFNELSSQFQGQFGMRLSGYREGGSVSDVRFVGGTEGMSPEQRRRYEIASQARDALQGASGFHAQFDAIQDVVAAARAGQLIAADRFLKEAFDMEEISRMMAQAFNETIASSVPVTVFENGAIQVLGDLSPDIQDMVSRTPSVFATLLSQLGD